MIYALKDYTRTFSPISYQCKLHLSCLVFSIMEIILLSSYEKGDKVEKKNSSESCQLMELQTSNSMIFDLLPEDPVLFVYLFSYYHRVKMDCDILFLR